jgi:hypothetical protein
MAIKPKMMKKGITKQSFDDVMGGTPCSHDGV